MSSAGDKRVRPLGIVLAGGRSSRFGSPKAGAPWGDGTLADRAVALVSQVCSRVGIVAGETGLVQGWDPPAGLEIRGDVVPGQGPLGGIVTGLRWAQEIGADGILVLPVDMPEIPVTLLGRILEEATSGPHVVVPESRGPRGFEPLCAWYSCEAGPELERRMAEGVRAPAEALQQLETVRIPVGTVEAMMDSKKAFLNVNRPEDLGRHQEAEAG
jgi:molybdopterin-guanine dinucleotide biosynthesis protein A